MTSGVRASQFNTPQLELLASAFLPQCSASWRPAGSSERRGMKAYPPDQQHSCKTAKTCWDCPGLQFGAPRQGSGAGTRTGTGQLRALLDALTEQGRRWLGEPRTGAASQARRRKALSSHRGARVSGRDLARGTGPRHGEARGCFLQPASKQVEGAAQPAAPRVPAHQPDPQ